jgi:Fe-Mn family superoxide dismutase
MAAPFKLAPLPWDEDALAPTISANTISFHYHKHHQTYVDTLNKLVEGGKFADMKLEEVVRATAKGGDDKALKVFARKTLPTLRMHKKMIHGISDKMA